VNLKIVDNVCGLCDVVGKIFINEEGEHGIRLEASRNVYAKNQIDSRKAVRIEDFINFRTVKEAE
jgi:phage nucleotide-binding protein